MVEILFCLKLGSNCDEVNVLAKMTELVFMVYSQMKHLRVFVTEDQVLLFETREDVIPPYMNAKISVRILSLIKNK